MPKKKEKKGMHMMPDGHMMSDKKMQKMMKQKMIDKKMGMPKGKGTMMVKGY